MGTITSQTTSINQKLPTFKRYENFNPSKPQPNKLDIDMDIFQDLADIGHWEFNLETNKLLWSNQVYKIFGYAPQELILTYNQFLKFVHPDDSDTLNETYADSVFNNKNFQMTFRIITKEGSVLHVEGRCIHQLDDNGGVIKSIGTLQDMTAKIENHKELQLASTVFTNSHDAIIITDKRNQILDVNNSFEKLTGYSKFELLGKNPKIIGSGWTDKDFYTQMWSDINTKGIWKGTIKDRKKSGQLYIADETIIAIKDNEGEVENYIGISSDITKLVNEQKEKQKALTTSSVGNLRNRNALLMDLDNDKLNHAALLDINSFHQIHEFYGPTISDKVLNQFSDMVVALTGNLCMVYHINADLFIVRSTSVEQYKLFRRIVESLITQISEHLFVVDEYHISLSLTSVMCSSPAESLLGKLDLSLKYAKKNRLPFWVYDESIDLVSNAKKNLHWTRELKNAFEEDRIVPFFQPIYSLNTNKIKRYEALVRLIDKKGNAIAPNLFLGAAEQSNQMFMLTKTMFLKTLETLNRYDEDYKFSINISFMDMQDKDFLLLIEEHLDNASLAQRICFEILETQSITDFDAVNTFVKKVHELGCQVAIDDFGSGYANFENLIKLDIDIIKIDGTLIEKVATHQDAYDLVDAIVGFAKKRNIKTVAEFVKNRELFEIAKKLNIDSVQGYFIDKPLAQPNINFDSL